MAPNPTFERFSVTFHPCAVLGDVGFFVGSDVGSFRFKCKVCRVSPLRTPYMRARVKGHSMYFPLKTLHTLQDSTPVESANDPVYSCQLPLKPYIRFGNTQIQAFKAVAGSIRNQLPEVLPVVHEVRQLVRVGRSLITNGLVADNGQRNGNK